MSEPKLDKFFDILMDTQRAVGEVQQTLNNGLKKEVKRNTTELKELEKKVNTLNENINSQQDQRTGVEKFKENLGWYFSAILFVLALLTHMGVI